MRSSARPLSATSDTAWDRASQVWHGCNKQYSIAPKTGAKLQPQRTQGRRALNFIYFGDANLPLSSPSRSELISFMFHLDRHQHHGSIHYASNQPSPSDHLSFILPASGAFRPHRATHDPSDSSLTPACLKRVRCAARRCLQLELPSKLTSSALPFSDTRRVLLPTPPPPPPPHLTPRHRCVVSVCLRVTRAARQKPDPFHPNRGTLSRR